MKTKVYPVDHIVALLTDCQQLSYWRTDHYAAHNKRMQMTLHWASKLFVEPRKRLHFTELNAFLKAMWSMPPFYSLHFFYGYFCDMHYALGTSPDSNSQLLCPKQLNRLDGCFFCNALGNKAPNNFTHRNWSIAGFLFFSAVDVVLQKAGATKLGAGFCLPNSLIWLRNALLAWIDRK